MLQKANLDCMIIDSNKNAILATPRLVVKLGEKAMIKSQDKNGEGYLISVLVK